MATTTKIRISSKPWATAGDGPIQLEFVDVSPVLDGTHYFVLDDHLRAESHLEVARLLCRHLAALDPAIRCAVTPG